ncbi:MAG: ABC transporter permease [Muribaculaceae bacterium]|nr:ABC transporter permease [Muribaculaceae bacterium]
MALKYLIEKEFKQMMRNKILPIIFLILPIAIINVIPRIATQEIKNLKFSVVDNDHSPLSQRLVHKITASTYFNLVGVFPSYEKALATIESCESDIILVIEPDFEKNLVNSGNANVFIAGNAVNGMKGALGSSYMLQIIADYSAQLRDEEGLNSTATRVTGYNVEPRFLYNSTLDYKLYMIPALMAMLLVLLVAFLPALNIVGEKEKGTIEQINVTPVGRTEFILSKLIPYAAVGIFLLSFAMVLAKAIHGFAPAGSIGAIYVFAIAFCLVVASLGLIISNYSDTTQQAALTMFFFIMIFMLMSGLLTPVASMPQWAQTLTLINPMRYFMEAMRTLYLKDAGLGELWTQLWRLGLMASGLWIWAIASYRKSS